MAIVDKKAGPEPKSASCRVGKKALVVAAAADIGELAAAPGPCRWDPGAILTYRVKNAPPGMTQPEAEAAVDRAFNSWQAEGGPHFVKELRAGQGVDVTLGWEHLGGALDVLADADYPGACSAHPGTLPKPVQFSLDHDWENGPGGLAFDVETVALHELGHILGLDHSSDPGAVMFAGFQEDVPKRQLAADDRTRFRALYGIPAAPVPGVSTAGIPPPAAGSGAGSQPRPATPP